MTPATGGAAAGATRTRIDALVLLATCAALAAYHFGKVESLVARDMFRWMLEARRVADGEVPYRDFASVYPPLASWAIGAVFAALGSTFVAAQVAVDALGALLVFLTWRLARKVVPTEVALAVALLTALGGAANTGNFALFSLQIYTPSILVGLSGLTVFLGALVDHARAHSPRELAPSQVAAIAVGATVACLSKVELVPAVVAACVVVAIARPGRGRVFAWLIAVAVGPALLAYVVLGAVVGPATLLEALSGYGLSRIVCPWWPTVLGVFSGLAALGEAAIVVLLASLPWARALLRAHRRGYRMLLGAAVIGAIVVWYELPFALQEFWKAQPRPAVWSTSARAMSVASYLLSLNGVLLPVMWTGILLVLRETARLLRRGPRAGGHGGEGRVDPGLLVIAAAASGVSLRGLFNHLFGDVSIVTQTSYPLWIIVLGWMLVSLLSFLSTLSSHGANRVKFSRIVAIALVSYGALRFAHRAHRARADGAYVAFATEAGPVLLHGDAQGVLLYQRVTAITTRSSRVLELPSGGGLAFAARRRTALYSALFVGTDPSARVIERDRAALRDAPPDVVVALKAPRLGTSVGLTRGCGFPRITLVTPDCDPSRVRLPVVEAIEASYRVDVRAGDRELLVPAERPSPE